LDEIYFQGAEIVYGDPSRRHENLKKRKREYEIKNEGMELQTPQAGEKYHKLLVFRVNKQFQAALPHLTEITWTTYGNELWLEN
jgi:hypothetical protein